MNDLTPEQHQLSASWAAVYEGAGQALEWIGQTRGNAPRLDSEADSLNIRLHRARNLAHSLGRVACTPMTIGFFGLSQAGKSYLISALAAGQNGKLETDFGGQRVDFIKHINPVGGGKEATGLVTRFSRRATTSQDLQFPVELKLFKEIELAKILTNSWFKDFDLERINYEIDEERIQRALKPFEGRENGPLQKGVSADDIVSLWDYLRENFRNSVRKLEHGYWPMALQLAPRLNFQERAELFSILWGEQSELTRVYQQLAGTLHKLGLPETVFAPLHALVRFESDGSYSQRDSIMNVDILERFGTSDDSPIEVRPQLDGRLQNSLGIPVAQLAALTAEMTFGLIEAPVDDIVDQVDLLDFPGYRGRKQLCEIANSNDPDSRNKDNSVSQLILRGKVAYLFERYTDNQEMNALVVCTSSNKQSDVNDVGPVLTRWIDKTQGETPEARGKRNIGLIWALTMLDLRVATSLSQTPDQDDEGWNGMVKLTMLERFGSLPWMNDWAGAPFQNTFMVRKPRLNAAFIQQDKSGPEIGINPDFQVRLDGLGKSFASNSLVCKHIQKPSVAWQEMLRSDDGGISYFSSSFNGVANAEFKLQRIREQLDECIESLTVHGLSTWYHADGDGAAAAKKAQAQMILSGLGRRPAVLGEFIDQLDMPSEEVRDLYLSGVYETDDAPAASDEPAAPTPSQSLYGNEPGFDFGDLTLDSAPASTAASHTPVPELQSNEHRFAKAAFKAWIAHLRELTTRQSLLTLLGLEKSLIEAVVDELITAGYRQDLPGQLSRAVLKRAQSGARRDQLVERQVLEVQRVLRDFVSWFGYIQKPVSERPSSRAGAKAPLFSFYTDIGPGQVPVLPPQPANQAQLFLGDWLSGLAYITLDNAGHGAGREITPEQNERLGHVLTAFTAR